MLAGFSLAVVTSLQERATYLGPPGKEEEELYKHDVLCLCTRVCVCTRKSILLLIQTNIINGFTILLIQVSRSAKFILLCSKIQIKLYVTSYFKHANTYKTNSKLVIFSRKNDTIIISADEAFRRQDWTSNWFYH